MAIDERCHHHLVHAQVLHRLANQVHHLRRTCR
jgi:hypothetical protein